MKNYLIIFGVLIVLAIIGYVLWDKHRKKKNGKTTNTNNPEISPANPSGGAETTR